MIKSFSQFVAEDAAKDIIFTFGKFNPPTIGHEKLIEKVADLAKGKMYRIYASQAEDPKKNPLSLTEKVKFMRKMFPRHARSIMSDGDAKNVLHVCSKLYEQGFTKVTLAVTEDRVAEMQSLLNAYNGKPLKEGGMFNFKEGVRVVGIGIPQDPDIMASATLCEAAAANDLERFSKGLPSSLDETRELFNAVRSGMGLKETHNFRKHIKLESVSAMREAYVNGEIFNVGDEVVIKESSEVGRIERRGPNYLVVGMHDGRKMRKWLNGVELVEKNLPVPVQEVSSQKVIEYDPSVTPGIPISKLRTNKQ